MKRVLHRCGCCGTHYDPGYAGGRVIDGRVRYPTCPGCGCADYEEVYEDDVE